MNILVYDVAAETGGATSILNHFYELHKKDTENKYFYLLSTYHLENTSNITVINEPEIKKSWLHRIKFDYFGAKRYLKQFKIDRVLSLQNTLLPCFKGRQTVYVHNALPFSEYRFSFKEDRLLWIYQNIIGRVIKSSIKKADGVIVQTDWMKDVIGKLVKGSAEKITVQFPEVDVPKNYNYSPQEKTVFFYPAGGSKFKNHRLILDACLLLKAQGVTDYSVVFTLNGDESNEIKFIFDRAKKNNLNFNWVGNLPREEVFSWYTKSVLIFPSYIETVGLPIYEAMSVGAPLLLADCMYSKNVANGYSDAQYFPFDDAECLANLMKQRIENDR